jgi:Transposase zinc-binding domain
MVARRPGAACAHVEGSHARVELADIVQARGEDYRARHRLSPVQAQALAAIGACRTAVLGGARYACPQCGFERLVYRSCLNRHCPKCQTLAKERWLAARRAELLPLPYFHLVFTLPHELNALAQGNPRIIYRLLFQAASETLLEFGANPRWLGGEIGFILVLHTWGQNLNQHQHS